MPAWQPINNPQNRRNSCAKNHPITVIIKSSSISNTPPNCVESASMRLNSPFECGANDILSGRGSRRRPFSSRVLKCQIIYAIVGRTSIGHVVTTIVGDDDDTDGWSVGCRASDPFACGVEFCVSCVFVVDLKSSTDRLERQSEATEFVCTRSAQRTE